MSQCCEHGCGPLLPICGCNNNGLANGLECASNSMHTIVRGLRVSTHSTDVHKKSWLQEEEFICLLYLTYWGKNGIMRIACVTTYWDCDQGREDLYTIQDKHTCPVLLLQFILTAQKSINTKYFKSLSQKLFKRLSVILHYYFMLFLELIRKRLNTKTEVQTTPMLMSIHVVFWYPPWLMLHLLRSSMKFNPAEQTPAKA